MPILTKSAIEHVHDLHGVFSALLARSNRTPTVYIPSDAPDAHKTINRLFPQQQQQHRKDGRKPQNKSSSLPSKSIHDSSLSGVSVKNVSLEELFLNIDRIIANDFLETLSNVE